MLSPIVKPTEAEFGEGFGDSEKGPSVSETSLLSESLGVLVLVRVVQQANFVFIQML
jgi:hypothetical protein